MPTFLCSNHIILTANLHSNRYEAKHILKSQSGLDPSEIEYLIDYYSLVREGKTNYISTHAFHDITGQHPQEPVDFFKVYADEFKSEHASKKRKVNAH
jgi:hypothetical protein